MKRLIKIFMVLAVILTGWNAIYGQTSRKEKKAAYQKAIKNMVDGPHFFFSAEYALPQRGSSKQLTSEYDLKVTKDSIIAYLPYYGQAYLAPAPGESEGGIKFTSTNFSYKQKINKNGWEIVIKPRDNDITNWRDVQQMVLDISPDGYASLSVLSSNRDPISFQGDIIAKE
jgi:hypothetical protein